MWYVHFQMYDANPKVHIKQTNLNFELYRSTNLYLMRSSVTVNSINCDLYYVYILSHYVRHTEPLQHYQQERLL